MKKLIFLLCVLSSCGGPITERECTEPVSECACFDDFFFFDRYYRECVLFLGMYNQYMADCGSEVIADVQECLGIMLDLNVSNENCITLRVGFVAKRLLPPGTKPNQSCWFAEQYGETRCPFPSR